MAIFKIKDIELVPHIAVYHVEAETKEEALEEGLQEALKLIKTL